MRSGLLRCFAMIVLVSLYLTGCGGASGTSSTALGGSDEQTVTPSISLRLLNRDETADITRIDSTNSGIVYATVENVTGNVIVTFATTLGILDPPAGTALTSGGVARITLESGEIAGAGQVSATITVDGDQFASNTVPFEVLPFEVVEEGVQLGICGGDDPFDCTAGAFTRGDIDVLLAEEDQPFMKLSSAGTATIRLLVLDADEQPVENVAITITSRCTNLTNRDGEPQAEISQVSSNANGEITATYQANGCVGTDTITAREPSSGESAAGSLSVERPEVGSIRFDSVTDSAGAPISTIYVTGSGGETSARVVFQILDVFGAPVVDQDVDFELTTNIGKLELQNDSRKSDVNGNATAFVNSGTRPTTVRVEARTQVDTDRDGVPDTTLFTQSDSLSVNTGLADQDSMTISISQLNVEGDVIGTDAQAEIKVFLSDAFNNPVRQNTVVQFQTEYGSIEPRCLTAEEGSFGACSVKWAAQEPRLPLSPDAVYYEVGDGRCPKPFVAEEALTLTDGKGSLLHKPEDIYRVEVYAADFPTVAGTNYTLAGTTITCTATPGGCRAGRVLTANYEATFIDTNRGVTNGQASITRAMKDTNSIISVFAGATALAQNTDYTVDADLLGITCVGGSATCINGASLTITYTSLVVDDLVTVGTVGGASIASLTYTPTNTPVITSLDFGLTEGAVGSAGAHWVTDGDGIHCHDATYCAGGRVKVSYDRMYLDDNGNGTYTRTYGRPTAPYVQRSSVPCMAAGSDTYIGALGQIRAGRSTILIYTQGEESFVDSNGNGVYDQNEPFVDLTEAFLDHNEDGVVGNPGSAGETRSTTNSNCYGPTAPLSSLDESTDECYQQGGDEDLFIDFNGDAAFNTGNGIYNGTLCTAEGVTAGYCTRDRVNIFKNVVVIDARSDLYVGLRDNVYGEYISEVNVAGTSPVAGTLESNSDVRRNDGLNVPAGTDFTIGHSDSQVAPGVGETNDLVVGYSAIRVDVADVNGNVPPADTNINFDSAACSVQANGSPIVPSTSQVVPFSLSVTAGAPSAAAPASGTVAIEATTPKGFSASKTFDCTWFE